MMNNRNPMTGEPFAHTTYQNGKWMFDRIEARASWRETDMNVLSKEGVVRWKSNGQVPFSDMLGDFLLLGTISREQYEASNKARKVDNDRFFAEYRRNQGPPSDEEIFEMRAAFGPGATVVDVISGRTIKL